ncbi:MAG: MmcQ/YjbR family DNA-binding protein [Bryobacteraceae bacterium]|nr:MmcQ/YjbR family DNA-binding protein [Bryobacteraceae bacterium]
MGIEWVRRFCLSLPHAAESVQWGNDLVFKVGGKMFAILPLEPSATALSFKCSPEEFAELIERPTIIPAPYLARAHWVALESEDALTPAEAKRLLRQAHELALAKLPKKLRAALRSGTESGPREKKRADKARG